MTDREIRDLVQDAKDEVGCTMYLLLATFLALVLSLFWETTRVKNQPPPPTVQENK